MIRCNAPAKINLGIRVLRKRPDGYHDIETVFYRIGIFDEITLEEANTIEFSCDSPGVPSDETNLCVRAARLVQERFAIGGGARITLQKMIPIGAGLGGGSSDAASTLLGLVKLWGISATRKDLHTLAVKLGADVPYFLNEGAAQGTGRGEVLEYFDLKMPYSIVVVYPRVHISTAWAYANVKPSEGPYPHSLKQIVTENLSDPRILMNLLRNDFEPVVLRNYPIVAEVKRELHLAGAVFTQLSGSGSAVFGLFTDNREAETCAANLRGKFDTFSIPRT
ncbi:MAG TPA: 4-(cytidine 5'-diphospho)-2-C-methyl-D-erythritol kinase [Bacteroidota bacterium]|nr:4-(cytidine 5'-diphospho)-2-C-methyl-D-erythritol kinase [Bacteroidota bacterium]